VEDKNGRKKGSFSYRYEGTDKQGLSKALVLSQTAKPTTSSESHLHPERGILLIILPVILFSAWVSNMWAACGLQVCIMRPVVVFVNLVHAVKITQSFRRLGIPLSVILPCAACEAAHNNGCNPVP
jgi:hypothetical protein